MQIITKQGRVYCVTTVPYPPEVVNGMKKAGYSVRTREKRE